MGIRHLICVQHNNEYKVANYGQWDGYPDGQGSAILSFLNEKFDKSVFIEKLNNLFTPTEQQIRQWYTEAGQTRTDGWLDMDVAQRFKDKYPSLSRDCGSDILPLIQNSVGPIPLVSTLEFAAESLFCEWAYVVDLDKNTFEVFKGFTKEPLDESERFASVTSPNSNDGYYQVRFVESFSLDDLPTEGEFLSKILKKLGVEEE